MLVESFCEASVVESLARLIQRILAHKLDVDGRVDELHQIPQVPSIVTRIENEFQTRQGLEEVQLVVVCSIAPEAAALPYSQCSTQLCPSLRLWIHCRREGFECEEEAKHSLLIICRTPGAFQDWLGSQPLVIM